MDRRYFLKAFGAACISQPHTKLALSAPLKKSFILRAERGETHLVGPDFPATRVWSFNSQVPGTPVRVKLGQTVKATLENHLTDPTSIHWHGIRLPNNMDGVAGLTQAAVKPGEKFDYEFVPPDAGTFWYHSHVNAFEQVGRGLYGPLIIDEPDPPKVDRDLIWMLDDWRLQNDASISEDFDSGHDKSHAGRIGNVPTVNGRFRDVVKVRSGERIRLRLINASNARNFSLTFSKLAPRVIAIDGQPVTPYSATTPIIVGVAGRVDLILDMTGEAGSRSTIVDNFYRNSFDLTAFVYEKTEPLRSELADWPITLQRSKLPMPKLAKALTQDVIIQGGAMGGLEKAKLDGQWKDLREIAAQGLVWAINDTVAHTLDMPPLIDVNKGTSVRLIMENRTAWPHPMHLHGHHMLMLSIDGKSLSEPRWVDSPLIMPKQRIELAFVADNPGKWLFHCHALEHHAAGLGALVNVT